MLGEKCASPFTVEQKWTLQLIRRLYLQVDVQISLLQRVNIISTFNFPCQSTLSDTSTRSQGNEFSAFLFRARVEYLNTVSPGVVSHKGARYSANGTFVRKIQIKFQEKR